MKKKELSGYELALVHGLEVKNVGYMAHNLDSEYVRVRRDESGLMKYSGWRKATQKESDLYWEALSKISFLLHVQEET